ncbi:SemiSWEET transporter [Piscinibacter sp. HJYY11]|uniref:SemiSWEET transporter n=1 Tax=Piscinibacter sp. HJYY11 TaxID=2801333 RepID=UPI00191E9F85|nr:SemiSWEET transporter [Piscinibacter sp. HJYY11]MBL0729773.1 SemiSWEET transporter [Piscinibacter sp. HJYY11]
MNFVSLEWLGYIAATLTTGSFALQAWHTFRTRDVSGISLGMYSAFTLGVALWLAYGLVLRSWPITIANMVTLALALSILAMKVAIETRRRRRR